MFVRLEFPWTKLVYMACRSVAGMGQPVHAL